MIMVKKYISHTKRYFCINIFLLNASTVIYFIARGALTIYFTECNNALYPKHVKPILTYIRELASSHPDSQEDNIIDSFQFLTPPPHENLINHKYTACVMLYSYKNDAVGIAHISRDPLLIFHPAIIAILLQQPIL